MIQRSQAMSDTRLAAALQVRKVATRWEFTWRSTINFTGTTILPIVFPMQRARNRVAVSFHLELPSGTALQGSAEGALVALLAALKGRASVARLELVIYVEKLCVCGGGC